MNPTPYSSGEFSESMYTMFHAYLLLSASHMACASLSLIFQQLFCPYEVASQ
ncbi:MAG: hypothetical protein GQ531_10365 [Sulfurovum sp.]|nr:hypothetical protein [Sulfurovum sp.]